MKPIYELGAYLILGETIFRSTFYRHRSLLSKKCSQIELNLLPLSKDNLRIAEQQVKCGFLIESDFEDSRDQEIVKYWKHLPSDRNFYQMLVGVDSLWKKYLDSSLEEFLHSSPAHHWLKKRRCLTNKPLFELHEPYTKSSPKALSNEKTLRALLHANPLLRYEDLLKLSIPNAQKNLERYKIYLEERRYRFLQSLKTSISGEAIQARGDSLDI